METVTLAGQAAAHWLVARMAGNNRDWAVAKAERWAPETATPALTGRAATRWPVARMAGSNRGWAVA